ncbi:transcriptional regulator, AraC family [Alteromonadaceae bacterium Bs31]|nr:transcriptional regulator, AraC family [Alteromonadaceae bacterium Bs31]
MIAHVQPCSFNPERQDFAPYGLTCVYWQPSPMHRPDHHTEIELNFLKSGSVTYMLGGQKTVVEVGKLSIFWGAIPHQIIDYAENTVYMVATIPLQIFLQWRLPEDFVQPLMQSKLISEVNDKRASLDAQLFDHWASDLSNDPVNYEETVLLEMQARLTRLALSFRTDASEGSSKDHLSSVTDIGMNKVVQMASYIAQNYTQKLTVTQIGELVSLHPNYAMNLFQKTFGTTLLSYLTQHRVSHAQRLLTTTDLPVVEVALQSGFSSISRFNEVFNRSCGCSPREYRKSHELQLENKFEHA